MVLQKRLDYGFNGYQVPAIPRASRSARGKSLFKRKVDNNQMCAFDLLATVAGKLLQEKETSLIGNNLSSGGANSSVGKEIIKKEQLYEKKPFKQEPCDQGSCDESVSAFHGRLKGHTRNRSSMGYSYSRYDVSLKLASVIPKSDISEKIAFLEESTGKTRNEFGDSLGTSHCNSSAEKSSPGVAESHRGKVEEEAEKQLQAEDKKVGIVKTETSPNIYSSDYPMESDNKPPTLVSSDSSVEVPICGDRVPHGGSFPRCQDNAIVNRDDDENSSVSTQPSTITMNTFRPSRIGDRRMRKFLGSKYWKVTPAMLKDGNLSSFDMEMKPSFRNRKMFYTRQRTQRGSSFKRRKLFERYSISTSDKGRSSGVANSHEKVKNVEATDPGATIVHRASETSSSVAGQKSSFGSGDSHVKLRIKSFKVPELFIEIPENATVGSLKRTVLETITAIFGGGLRVGVLLQGKKVRDDNKTLIQTGICHDDKLDNLGFTLEPDPALSPPSPLCSGDAHFIPHCEATPHLTRYPSLPAIDQGASDATPDLPLTNSSNCVESNHDLVPSPIDMSLDKTSPDSRALVAIPPLSVEALAVVPLHRKSRRSELVQRRIRRPFSVTEVEALVQAVEKLGTGRWRDVKLRAFENAKHRTYVDLKDKWKTLVHTARISPQQRRGEPVPQELLDRVLAAHAYWSHQQAKLQVKQQGGESC